MAKNTKKQMVTRPDIASILRRVKRFAFAIWLRIATSFKRRPFLSFFITLGILLVFIILANILGRPKTQNVNTGSFVKSVSIYRIGSAPKISLPAKIEKSGVIKIVAQSAGVVSSVPVTEGNSVAKGTTIIDLASTYSGADAAGIQVHIAQEQNTTVIQTFQTQKDIINQQRQVATQSAANTVNLQQIAAQSAQDTQTLIHYDQDIITTLNQQLASLTASNAGGGNDALILQTKSLVSQFQSGINQLNSALRQSQYQSNAANPPIILNNLQLDITLKQLDIQEKTLAMNKEISALQLNLAYLNESLMHPVSPVSGTVQRVYVTVGQAVTPGTPLAVISADGNGFDVTAVVSVPQKLAQSVSRIESSIVHLGNQDISLTPRFVSQDATDGNLYTILYSIPDTYQSSVTNTGYVTIDVPIGIPDTDKTVPFVPLDSIYQTQDEAYVYVVSKNHVQSKTVSLGTVYGRFVQITSGLSDGDQVILDRTVIAGDNVRAK